MKRKSLDVVEPNTDEPIKAHITLKAVTTVTDEGVFEAVISTQSIDREKDIVDADGMVKALRKWPRQIPTTWEHSTRPEDIFGHIDPQSVKNVNGEVVAKGQVDLESTNGADAWRSFKARRVGFSFAYMMLASTPRKGGGRHITELDIFEITATRTPMNNDTRVLSTKGVDELRDDSKRLEREVEELKIPEIPEQPKAPAEPEIDLAKELQEVKARLATAEQAVEDLRKKADETDKAPEARSVDPLRKRSEELALEVASGGMSLRKPPAQVKETKAEPVDTDELKRQSRDLMFEVLSYSTE